MVIFKRLPSHLYSEPARQEETWNESACAASALKSSPASVKQDWDSII